MPARNGQRQVLAVEMANRESQSSWKEFLLRLKERGLSGVEFVVFDDHAGLKKAIFEVLTESAWQRCYVHFLRNALDYLPRKADDDCLQELRWIYDRRDSLHLNFLRSNGHCRIKSMSSYSEIPIQVGSGDRTEEIVIAQAIS